MSIDWLAAAWITKTGSPTKKAVLMALADRSDDDGISWPSYRDVMERTELRKTAVRVAIEELQVDGLIRAWARDRQNKSQTSNGYKLLIDRNKGGAVSRHGGAATRQAGVPSDDTPEPAVEPAVGTSVRRRAATSHQVPRPKGKLQPRESDEPSSSDESPSLGSARRKSNDEVKVAAVERGTSGFGLALRLQKGLGNRRDSLAIVDVRALAKRLNDSHRAGQSRELQAAMIEMFAANPTRYHAGDLKGWTAFLAAVPKLEADAGRRGDWQGEDDDPYADEKSG